MIIRLLLLVLVLGFTGLTTGAAEPRVVKVLPHLLDLEGRHSTSPSLFDRDAYQAWLRENPGQQSGLRYDVQWRAAAGEYTLKVELLGRVVEGRPLRKTVEQQVTASRTRTLWSGIEFAGEEFKEFGRIVAWRVSLWQDDKELARQQSFLWE